ncbi:hypothetical protein P175DRAFT_088429 [Aspergillus ochraceoroseus IBT 24754]|uniref:Uncharacterized protein n=1 Tax=Aspergillus ochraceoroseus IBT 24754 TaxID=1392256 RepID=A0A2T5LM90_9EURO|nr:uncharacterized protein P175DRAFT_088429 [Aspergillus ochraceoroseus IBT 24754]PTU17401.1 hypothetical protein P175DRAFT_088429 [Aspergillus ochraceoroseus IBT 24754]
MCGVAKVLMSMLRTKRHTGYWLGAGGLMKLIRIAFFVAQKRRINYPGSCGIAYSPTANISVNKEKHFPGLLPL